MRVNLSIFSTRTEIFEQSDISHSISSNMCPFKVGNALKLYEILSITIS